MTVPASLPYHVQKLSTELELRKKRNPNFSLRSYSRVLNLNSGTLSQVLAGKRELSFVAATSICQKLKFSKLDTQYFLESVQDKQDYFPHSETLTPSTQQRILGSQEHLLLLSLFRLDSFRPTPQNVADKLGISEARAQVCLDDLLELELLQKDLDGQLKRTANNLNTTHNVLSEDLRTAHERHLDLAKDKLKSLDTHERSFVFMNVVLDDKNYEKLKKMILKFHREVSDLDDASAKKRVYRMGFQCFPVTK